MRRAAHSGVLTLVVVATLLAAPGARAAGLSGLSLAAGGGDAFPPGVLGVETRTPDVSAMASWSFLPTLALVSRGSIMSAENDTIGYPSVTLLHIEFNLDYSPRSAGRFVPFVTAGVGGVRMHGVNALAMNGGAGLVIHLNSSLGFRFDARDVAYRIPRAESQALRQSLETFAGVQISLHGTLDSDGDGIPDNADHCPGTPRGAIVDDDGCPIDGDHDGVPDGIDLCIATPPGVVVDAHGCPIDTDGDGVYDGLDRCPDTPHGARVDPDGCPTDSDSDGVLDGLDRCPDTPRGCKVDSLGCEHDEDGDGVCDGVDQCPGTPPHERVDAHGCPLPVGPRERTLLDTGTLVLDDLRFESGTAIITADSYSTLNDMAVILARWPGIRIEIDVYANSPGDPEANRLLSDARARAVLTYFLSRVAALKPEQFTTAGFAGATPAPRVEIRVLNPEIMRGEARHELLVPGH